MDMMDRAQSQLENRAEGATGIMTSETTAVDNSAADELNQMGLGVSNLESEISELVVEEPTIVEATSTTLDSEHERILPGILADMPSMLQDLGDKVAAAQDASAATSNMPAATKLVADFMMKMQSDVQGIDKKLETGEEYGGVTADNASEITAVDDSDAFLDQMRRDKWALRKLLEMGTSIWDEKKIMHILSLRAEVIGSELEESPSARLDEDPTQPNPDESDSDEDVSDLSFDGKEDISTFIIYSPDPPLCDILLHIV
ncbi:hypothetical protein C8R46DRAFT_1212410 [Mycena filopes]|nr:hypothetical protein C8R46DRAFT_1212410 [Mycena filopes]